MILRDEIIIDGVTVPAEVQPLRSTEQAAIRGAVIVTLYQLFVGPDVVITTTSEFTWHGQAMSMLGIVEQWRKNGELHHQEATLQAVSGPG